MPSAVSTLLPSQFQLCSCAEKKTPLSHSCKNKTSSFSIGAQGMLRAGTGSPRHVHSWRLHRCILCHVLWVSLFTPLLPPFFFPCHSSWNFFQVFSASCFVSTAQMALCQVKMREGTSHVPVCMNYIFCHCKGTNLISHTQNPQLEIL